MSEQRCDCKTVYERRVRRERVVEYHWLYGIVIGMACMRTEDSIHAFPLVAVLTLTTLPNVTYAAMSARLRAQSPTPNHQHQIALSNHRRPRKRCSFAQTCYLTLTYVQILFCMLNYKCNRERTNSTSAMDRGSIHGLVFRVTSGDGRDLCSLKAKKSVACVQVS